MENQSTIDHLNRLFESCCIELFQQKNCNISRTEEPASISGSDPIGTLDAGSDELELIVFLQLPLNVLSLTYPTSDVTTVGEEELEDWTAELCNQLIGRIKNKLLNHNLRLDIGLPNAYFGSDISELLPSEGIQTTYRFSVDNEVLEATLVIDLQQPDLILSEDEDSDSGPEEGELELF